MRSFLTVLAICCAWNAYAQGRGAFLTAATPGINPMNPNGDGFITSTGMAFSGPLDETEFELPFISFQTYELEPGADNQYAPGCEFYELASDPDDGADPAYFYFSNPDGIADNGDENLVFRFRVARFSNGSTAFSILIDTDYAFGFEGAEADPNAVKGNPGFEKEIALFNNTGADGGVRVFNVDGNAQPVIVDFYAPISSHYQVAYALNQDPSCSSRVPVFVDMYVPFSSLGISSICQIRMAAAANEDIATSLNGGASDISGIDGNKIPDDDLQYITLINNFLPIRVDQPANIAPLGADATLTLDENRPKDLLVHTVTASDPNGEILSFAIGNGNTNNAFVIDATTGNLFVNNSQALDHELTTSFTLVIRVSDGSLYNNIVLTINLNDLNDNPPSSPDAIVSLNENSLNGTIVHAVGTIDPDLSSTLVHSLTGGSGAAVFAVDEASGLIMVTDFNALNFESVQAFTLMIHVSDGLYSDDAQIIINIRDVNEPPSLRDKMVTIPENMSATTVIHILEGTDPDANEKLFYSITEGNTGDAFVINALTGEISVNNSLALDFENFPLFNLKVIVSDGELTGDARIIVDISNVNEPPVVIGASVLFGDTLRNDDVVYVAVANDQDAGDVLTYSLAHGNEYPVFTIDSQTGEVVVTGLEEIGPGIISLELIITATDADGLSGNATVVLHIEKKSISPAKGFSPDGDQQNDFWWIDGIEGFPDNTVKVYNRWGHQVAEIPAYNNNSRVWTGNETDVRSGIESTYFFIIRAGRFQPITGYVIVKP